jgi:hypothetical protein
MIDLETELRRVLNEDAVVTRSFTVDDVRERFAEAPRRNVRIAALAGAAASVLAVGWWTVARGHDGRVVVDATTSSSPAPTTATPTTIDGTSQARPRFFLPTKLPAGMYPLSAGTGTPYVEPGGRTLTGGDREIFSASRDQYTRLNVLAGSFALADPSLSAVTIHGVSGLADATHALWTEKGFTLSLEANADAAARAESVLVGSTIESIAFPDSADGAKVQAPKPTDWYFSAQYASDASSTSSVWLSVGTTGRLVGPMPEGATKIQLDSHQALLIVQELGTSLTWEFAPGVSMTLSSTLDEQALRDVALSIREVDESAVQKAFGAEYRTLVQRASETTGAADRRTVVDQISSSREVLSLFANVVNGDHCVGFDTFRNTGGMLSCTNALVHYQDDRLVVATFLTEQDDRVEVVVDDLVAGEISGRASPDGALLAYGTLPTAPDKWGTQAVKVRLVNDRLETTKTLFDVSNLVAGPSPPRVPALEGVRDDWRQRPRRHIASIPFEGSTYEFDQLTDFDCLVLSQADRFNGTCVLEAWPGLSLYAAQGLDKTFIIAQTTDGALRVRVTFDDGTSTVGGAVESNPKRLFVLGVPMGKTVTLIEGIAADGSVTSSRSAYVSWKGGYAAELRFGTPAEAAAKRDEGRRKLAEIYGQG